MPIQFSEMAMEFNVLAKQFIVLAKNQMFSPTNLEIDITPLGIQDLRAILFSCFLILF